MKKNIKSIALSDLRLDIDNVRFGTESSADQSSAIAKFMEDPKNGPKIIKLAEDIADFGMDPSELQLVYKDNDINSYVVLEGNRRLTALLLLSNPELCPVEKYIKRLKDLNLKANINTSTKIDCSIVDKRKSADRWIELKHTGENKGAGRVDWDGDARDEFRSRQNSKDSIGRQIRNLIESSECFAEETVKAINEINITTLTRIFSSKASQKIFKLKVKNKKLFPELDLKNLAPAIEYAVLYFHQNNMTVKDVYKSEDIQKFLDEIPKDIIVDEDYYEKNKKEYVKEKDINENKEIEEKNDGNVDNTSDSEKGNDVEKREKKSKVRPSSTNRKNLINYSLEIEHPRINELYKELKTKIHVDSTPNAAAIMFRVFIELSCDHFIKKEEAKGNPVNRADNKQPIDLQKNVSLSQKVQSVAEHLKSNGILKAGQVRAIRKRAAAPDTLGSIDHLNEFVHQDASSPLPRELKLIADDYSPFIKGLWVN